MTGRLPEFESGMLLSARPILFSLVVMPPRPTLCVWVCMSSDPLVPATWTGKSSISQRRPVHKVAFGVARGLPCEDSLFLLGLLPSIGSCLLRQLGRSWHNSCFAIPPGACLCAREGAFPHPSCPFRHADALPLAQALARAASLLRCRCCVRTARRRGRL